MPLVLAEGEIAGATKAGLVARPRRPLGRGGLPLLCAVLALIVAAPLVPLIRPVKLHIAGHVVAAGTVTPANSAALPQGLSNYSFTASWRFEDPEHVGYVAQGPVHVNALRVRDWICYLVWFRGQRK